MYGLRHCVLEDFQNVVVCASDGWVPTFGGMLKRLGKAVTIANRASSSFGRPGCKLSDDASTTVPPQRALFLIKETCRLLSERRLCRLSRVPKKRCKIAHLHAPAVEPLPPVSRVHPV